MTKICGLQGLKCAKVKIGFSFMCELRYAICHAYPAYPNPPIDVHIGGLQYPHYIQNKASQCWGFYWNVPLFCTVNIPMSGTSRAFRFCSFRRSCRAQRSPATRRQCCGSWDMKQQRLGYWMLLGYWDIWIFGIWNFDPFSLMINVKLLCINMY
jgi:hypothetical protein